MSLETDREPLDINEIEQAAKTESYLESLRRDGVSVGSLVLAVDPTPTKALAEEIAQVRGERKNFNERKGIIMRRSRRFAQALMRRHR
jgi:hypothetical protein